MREFRVRLRCGTVPGRELAPIDHRSPPPPAGSVTLSRDPEFEVALAREALAGMSVTALAVRYGCNYMQMLRAVRRGMQVLGPEAPEVQRALLAGLAELVEDAAMPKPKPKPAPTLTSVLAELKRLRAEIPRMMRTVVAEALDEQAQRREVG